ncbi:cobalamin biosynthesis protein CobW [Phreatobacter sp.]|uniref:cobalamin biosynthesis protein CobW n=1 Tax=Phreatobacter sp. TaxID=1966341 RepID=UPI003F72D935
MSLSPASAAIPVTILTGFLGAGKTTLLRHVLTEAHGKRIAVIVNEFGDLGFDGGLIAGCNAPSCAPDDVVELTNGCICCTLADDFLPTMEKLLARSTPLDAILIETSGLALPQPLVKAFQWPTVKGRATVDAVVTLVDAAALAEGRLILDDHAAAGPEPEDHDEPIEEVFEDQLACADIVVLTKTDLVQPDRLDAIEAELHPHLRAGIRLVRSSGTLAPDVLLGLMRAAEDDLSSRHGHHGEGADHEHDDFDSTVMAPEPFGSRDEAVARLRKAMATEGVLRIKGHALIAGKPAALVVQGVGDRVDTAFAAPGSAARPGLVVIGLKGFDAAAVSAALAGS